MPSKLPLHTIEEFRSAFHGAVRGTRDRRADGHAGSVYDHFAGLGAILWSRQEQRDRDLFEGTYFDTADGSDLTEYASRRDGIDRITDAQGVGSARLMRASVSSGAGTIWSGTRIRIGSSFYSITSDVAVVATQSIVDVPIQSVAMGPSVAIVSSNGIVDDPLFDTWQVVSLTCGPGTTFEKAGAFRARVRQSRIDRRPGFRVSIINACKSAGATYVEPFPSDYAGAQYDYGINVVYVADAGMTTPPWLMPACMAALESVRVCGATISVRPFALSRFTLSATIHLWSDVTSVAANRIKQAVAAAAVEYFSGEGRGYGWQVDALAGAMRAADPANIQTVITNLVSDSPIITGSLPQLPPVLTKYTLSPNDIALTMAGPI